MLFRSRFHPLANRRRAVGREIRAGGGVHGGRASEDYETTLVPLEGRVEADMDGYFGTEEVQRAGGVEDRGGEGIAGRLAP